MKILIAEDSDITCLKLNTILTNWNYDVVTAQDGTEAWETLTGKDAPKLALLDWNMPGMSGVELCQKIRKEVSDSTYIILLTARDDKHEIIEGLRSGANDYIVKPFDIDILKVRIEAGQRVLDLQTSLANQIAELKKAARHIKRLQGIMPICMYCKKIRNDQQSWEQMEKYISEHSNAQFSHGICPNCVHEHFPGVK